MVPHAERARQEGGFTLIEALVALGIVATVVISFIGIRTSALIDATYARNWRLAREIAEQKMSELQAGARETAPESGTKVPLEDYEGWSYTIVLGESAVSQLESEIGAEAAGDNAEANDRLDWQRERDNFRRAKSRGLSAAEFAEEQHEDISQRLAEKAPSATDFEEVGVAVYFPKLEADYPGQLDALLIKARLSTLAISGMTPQQAEAVAASMGQAAGGASGGLPGGAGGAPAGGAPTSGGR
jgi:type II secretion system protein I